MSPFSRGGLYGNVRFAYLYGHDRSCGGPAAGTDAAIKQHPTIGYGILKDITEYPFLSIAAHYHHKRYEGRGYPEGLKGRKFRKSNRRPKVCGAGQQRPVREDAGMQDEA